MVSFNTKCPSVMNVGAPRFLCCLMHSLPQGLSTAVKLSSSYLITTIGMVQQPLATSYGPQSEERDTHLAAARGQHGVESIKGWLVHRELSFCFKNRTATRSLKGGKLVQFDQESDRSLQIGDLTALYLRGTVRSFSAYQSSACSPIKERSLLGDLA